MDHEMGSVDKIGEIDGTEIFVLTPAFHGATFDRVRAYITRMGGIGHRCTRIYLSSEDHYTFLESCPVGEPCSS